MKKAHQLTKTEKESFWRKHITAQERSGKSQSAYCRKENLAYGSFRFWKKKLAALEADTGQLVEIPVAIQATDEKSHVLEIILSYPPRISIPDSYNPEALRRLLKVLGVSL